MFYNKLNRKIYIVAATNMSRAYSQLMYRLKKGTAPKRLQQDYDELGDHNFEVRLLKTCSNEALKEVKEHYLEMYRPYQYNNKGYNSASASNNWGKA